MNRTATTIAIAVVQQGEAFLIGQRPEHVVLGGYWEFPGGKVKDQESPVDAAVRECWEETGIRVRVRFAYPEHIHEYDHARLRLFFFACEPLTPFIHQPKEPFRWVDREELSNYEFPAANHQVLERLKQAKRQM